ncbi:hypothetical protein [Gelidibacter gilvus]|uniref:Uncharacterized protein n=1 Tax=Gelidibacter gilvus TaxID=59602 RepID=A0A4V1LN23_9FLAO|nr:hypothetical protein [Gelidibacter gilvus]RXJ50586.1 hypothetical protein ESZ48_07450 [Gelidibacter gilvus]
MEQWEKLPVFQKAREIMDLVGSIIESVEKTDIEFGDPIEVEMMQHNLKYMGMNASIIPAKIAGASSEDMLYDIRMENATIIRKAAMELITDARGLQMHGYPDTEYLDILRNEVEEFRVLFAEWVKTFDCWNYIIDRWGLFNPPGVNYDDVDPDDDIPFNFDDFDGFDDL